MNNEETRLINENEVKENGRRKGNRMAFGAGGFVAGAAAGMGVSAAAASTASDEVVAESNQEQIKVQDQLEAAPASEGSTTPEAGQAILANDEGIRYAMSTAPHSMKHLLRLEPKLVPEVSLSMTANFMAHIMPKNGMQCQTKRNPTIRRVSTESLPLTRLHRNI